MHKIHCINHSHAADKRTSTRRNISPTLRIAIFVITFVAILANVESFVLPSVLTTGRSQHMTALSSNGVEKIMVDESMSKTYDTLATRLLTRYEKEIASNNLPNNQLFICIAGGPGSGKSTLSSAVAQRINDRVQRQEQQGATPNNTSNHQSKHYAVVLPMDGFHYSRSQLQEMGSSSDNGCTYDELLARRGAPWTFDAEGCIATFVKARKDGKANLPIYSRAKSDPVPNGVELHSHTKIVLLEGNYLLAWEDKRWAPLQTFGVFDETWYIACQSLEEQRERLVQRHLETWTEEKTRLFGEGAEGAGVKADGNDMLNLEWIEEMSRKHADYVIESV